MTARPKSLPLSLLDVRAAARRIRGQVERTPCRPAQVLSELTGSKLHLKFENLQFTSSFKERGALNKLLGLSRAELAQGVIAVSAGNHAQAVAHHSRRLGARATIVMPETTPFAKVSSCESLGAEVVLYGGSLSEALARGRELCQERNLTFVHPYDDPLVVAGQGTVALEILKQVPELDDVVVPVGGGGLIGGVALAIKAISPRTRVVGVQTDRYPSFVRWFERKKPAPPSADAPETVAEGIAVKDPSELTRGLVRTFVDEMMGVSEDRIEDAINLLLEYEKTVAEGAGAAALALVLTKPLRFAGRRVALILSGGNIDQRVLADVILRGLARSGRLSRLRVGTRDLPGALAKVSQIIASAGGNIVDVHHQRVFSEGGDRTQLEFDIATRDRRHADHVVGRLSSAGYRVEVMGTRRRVK